jgi:NRAMP (natural resistance-associated macrophage protein)-like metal ion transporter
MGLSWLEKLRQRPGYIKLALFFSIMGPGIITANVDNDAGGITTYSAAGAHFGYALLWSLIPITVALILIQEMCNRMGIVTGKGLSSLIREKFGVKFTFYLMLLVLLTNFGNIIAEFAGVAASAELFGVSKFISVPLAAMFVWYLVVKGTYKSVEKIFLAACVFYIAYLVTGFLVKPDWLHIGREFVTPTLKFKPAFLVMLIGVVGTTIAPWMQFYQQASVAEKGISIKDYAYSKADTVIGSISVNLIAFFIIVVCGAVLFVGGNGAPVIITTAADAAKSLAPLAGKYAALLFAFGLLNASMFAASILPLSTAYSMCESFGWETGVNKRFTEAPQFYSLYTVLILLGAGLILLPKIPLIQIMLVSQVVNGIVLPFVLVAMLVIINDKKIMGEHTNSRTGNVLSIAFTVAVSALSLILAVVSLTG